MPLLPKGKHCSVGRGHAFIPHGPSCLSTRVSSRPPVSTHTQGSPGEYTHTCAGLLVAFQFSFFLCLILPLLTLCNPPSALKLAFCIHLHVDVLELCGIHTIYPASHLCQCHGILFSYCLKSYCKAIFAFLSLSLSLSCTRTHTHAHNLALLTSVLLLDSTCCLVWKYILGCSLPHSHHQFLSPVLHHFTSGSLRWLLTGLPTFLSLF